METEVITKKEYIKKFDRRTKAGMLFLAQQSGLTDIEAAKVAGITPQNVPNLEATKTYQAGVKKFGEVLKEKITLGEMADELIKNIVQDTDKGAKNMSLKMAKEYIEPETEQKETSVVNVVIKKDEQIPEKADIIQE